MSKRQLRKIGGSLLGAVVVLGAAGCGRHHHEESVNAGAVRWLTMRSVQMLAMARQQFATGDLDQAQKTVRDALVADLSNADLLVLSARIALERGHLERSYHLLNRAIEIDVSLAEAHYYQGLVMERWKQVDAALIQYKHAYDLEADNVAYLLAISEMLVKMQRVDEARELLESKVTYFEQNAGIREALGQLLAMQRKFDKAVNYFREASLLRPDDAQIREELGLTLLAAGQLDEAIRMLEELCGETQQDGRRDLRLALADAYQAAGRLEQATATCRDLTRRDPSDAEAWQRLAELAWLQQDLTGTLVAAGRLCKAAPDRPQGYLLAAIVWQKRGQIERALRLYDKAANADQTGTDAVLLQGIALEQAGRSSAASEAYRKALERCPADERAKQLLARLQAGTADSP